MKGLVSILVLGVLAGCQQQAPSFSWYHPQGGEYLFAYDREQCEVAVNAGGHELGTDVDGPFFACMLDRGYFLVNGLEVLREPTGQAVVVEPQITGLE